MFSTTKNFTGRFLSRKLLSLFKIDIRALALFRISLAIMTLYDLIVRSPYINLFYSDDGLLPRSLVIPHNVAAKFSVYFINGTSTIQALLFIAAFIFAFGLLLGYQSRVTAFLTWFMLASLQVRAPRILDGGDHVLRIFLFWAMFLPLGARFSIDSHHPKAPPIRRKYFSIATVVILLQYFILYFSTGCYKAANPLWQSGEAVSYAIKDYLFMTPWSLKILNYPFLLKILTWGTLGIEILAPLLLFSPFFSKASREIASFSLFGLQMAIWSCIPIGMFPLTVSLPLILFLSSSHLNNLENRFLSLWKNDRFALMSTRAKSIFSKKFSPLLKIAPYKLYPAKKSLRLCGLLGVLVLFWNLQQANAVSLLTPSAQNILYSIGLDQYWRMYANPPQKGFWYISAMTLKDGRVFDFWSNQPLNWDPPQPGTRAYHSHRFLKQYLSDVYYFNYTDHYPRLVSWIEKTWRENHPDKPISKLELILMETDHAVQTPAQPPQKTILWTWDLS